MGTVVGLRFPDSTRAREVARTVVAPPSSVVKCLWEVSFGGLRRCSFRVCVYRACYSLSVCVCNLLIFEPSAVLCSGRL